MTPSVFTRLIVTVTLIAAAACGAASGQRPIGTGPVDQGAGSLTAARKFLEGRWALESFAIYQAGKPVTMKGSGSLTYDDFGNLRMEIRADPESAATLKAAGIDSRDGVISSDGRTVVDMQARTLTYVIPSQAAAAGTGPLAANRKRHWEVEGDVLTLTTKDDAGNPASVGRWRKLP